MNSPSDKIFQSLGQKASFLLPVLLLFPKLSPASEGESFGGFLVSHMANSNTWHYFPGFHVSLEGLQFRLFGIEMGISLHVLMILFAGTLCFLVLKIAARRLDDLPTSRLGHAIEAIVIYLREDLVIPAMGQKQAKRWLPFLLTLFFFLLFVNLIGLVPGMSTASTNINFTAALSIMVFVVFNASGMIANGPFHYIKGLVPSGIPAPVLLILFPIELLGIFTKAAALSIRLFANMTAGHIIILSLLGLITVLKMWMPAVGFVGGALFIYGLEIFVGFLQAYVFTMLTTLFIGGAIHQEH